MQNAVPPGMTRVLGKAQGFLGLHIADCISDEGLPMMLSHWTPTPAELEALNKGANVTLLVMGSSHPPIRLDVGEPPGD